MPNTQVVEDSLACSDSFQSMPFVIGFYLQYLINTVGSLPSPGSPPNNDCRSRPANSQSARDESQSRGSTYRKINTSIIIYAQNPH